MDVATQDLLTAVVLAAVGGSLIGWVSGNKMRKDYPLNTPQIVMNKGWVLVFIGLVMIGACFAIGIWQGLGAVVLAYIANSVAGSRVLRSKNTGFIIVLKIALIISLIICLPITGYWYYTFYRTPSESYKLSFLYDCESYLVNEVWDRDSDSRNTAESVCGCLWQDLAGKYKYTGEINKNVRSGNKLALKGKDTSNMTLACLEDYHNR